MGFGIIERIVPPHSLKLNREDGGIPKRIVGGGRKEGSNGRGSQIFQHSLINFINPLMIEFRSCFHRNHSTHHPLNPNQENSNTFE